MSYFNVLVKTTGSVPLIISLNSYIANSEKFNTLNGKLFVDHISKLKKNRIIKKLEKIKKTKNL